MDITAGSQAPCSQDLNNDRLNARVSPSASGSLPPSTSHDTREDKRILVVDDDRAIVNVLCELLHLWGYECLAASNGREGLAALKGNAIEGVLLDVNMPVMNGLTMLDELRWMGSPIPVILMSGEHHEAYSWHPNENGAQAFLSKPFSPRVLERTCIRVFGVPASRASPASRTP